MGEKQSKKHFLAHNLETFQMVPIEKFSYLSTVIYTGLGAEEGGRTLYPLQCVNKLWEGLTTTL